MQGADTEKVHQAFGTMSAKGLIRIRQATASGWDEMENGGVCDLSYPESKTRRGRIQGGGKISPTLMANQSDIVKITVMETKSENKMTTFKVGEKECVALVRKLTEKECLRLMGVDDADIEQIRSCGVSRSAMYKMAGNSIVVDVLYHMFRKMWIEPKNESQQMSIFDLM